MDNERLLFLWWTVDEALLWVACDDLRQVVEAVGKRDPHRWREPWHPFSVRRENGDTAEGTMADLREKLAQSQSNPEYLSGDIWGTANDDYDSRWDSSITLSADWRKASNNLTLTIQADIRSLADQLMTDVLDVIESRGGLFGVSNPRPVTGSTSH